MIFATVAECEPPLGFEIHPTLKFHHFATNFHGKKYPTANTRGPVLYLPVVQTYDEFCEVMHEGILMAHVSGSIRPWKIRHPGICVILNYSSELTNSVLLVIFCRSIICVLISDSCVMLLVYM